MISRDILADIKRLTPGLWDIIAYEPNSFGEINEVTVDYGLIGQPSITLKSSEALLAFAQGYMLAKRM